MLVFAGVRSGQRQSRRIWNALFGAAFTIYGLYLLLFFRGGHYFIFFYAFIVPILMIRQFFRDRSAFRAGGGQATAFRGQPQGYGAPPPGYGQPQSFGTPEGYGPPAAEQPDGSAQ